MYRSKPNMKVRSALALVATLCVLPLAGCVTDDIVTQDDTIMPYGGSKVHPIKVVNGKAVVEPCGQWPSDLSDSSSNGMSLNHGCAVQANIAAMAANPQDLVRARRMSPSPAYKGVNAVKALASGTASSTSSSSSASTSTTPAP
jgi:Pilus biogenesis CpaD protein (pilus_cpaD)